MRSLHRLTPLLAGLVVVGCDCEKPISAAVGEVRWEWETKDGPQSGEAVSIDFGTISMGSRLDQIVFVRNIGRGPFNLSDIVRASGDPVTVQGRVEMGALFEFTFEQDREVPPSERQPITFSFTPIVRTDVKGYDAASQLDFVSVGAPNSPIEVRGRAISGECELPDEIDFGIAPVGTMSTQEIDIRNEASIPVRVSSGAQQGAPAGVFVLTGLDSSGSRDLTAGEQAKATVTFTPTETRDYQARVSMRRTQSCPEKIVVFRGRGVSSCLSFRAEPPDDPQGTSLFFGFVAPSTSATGTAIFLNACSTEVQLSALATTDPVFTVTNTPGGDLTRLTVPAATKTSMGTWKDGIARAELTFRPIGLGPKTGRLNANTSLSGQAQVAIPLRGIGGGPRIDVRPNPLSMGRIGFTPNASPPTFAPRTLRVANVGTQGSDPRGFLRLGMGGMGTPYWSVAAITGTLNEICVGDWDQSRNGCTNTIQPNVYNPTGGIEAAARAALNVPIRIIPASAGLKEFELTIFSNDAMNPETKVRITAEAVEAPPCNYEVVPGQLNFGVVDMPQTRDLQFTLRNRGIQPNDVCYFSAIELAPGSDDTFSLPQGAVPSLVLQPGQQVPITVRAAPTRASPPTPTQVRGEITFGVSTPGASQGRVLLLATLAPTCVTIAPDPLDFMNAELECGSPARTVSITNTCSTSLTLTGVSLVDPALVPVGTGSCATAGGCPQFAISAAATTGTISPGTSRTVQLRFRPFVLGAVNGGLSVTVTQSGQSITYPLPLRGTGIARTMMGCAVSAMCPAPITVGANSQVTLLPSVMAPGPVSCQWAVSSRPATANGTFSAPTNCTSTNYFADVVGTHVVNFTVSDGLGGSSTCSTPITVTPNGDLWIELTWDRNNDQDLHLIHPMAGPWNAVTSWGNNSWDCNFRQRGPSWGTAQQSPNLDRDDITGRGPENTRINTPQNGLVYTIGVHMYSWVASPTPVLSTLKLYCGGQLVTTQTKSMNRVDDMWVVGSVQFGSVSPCQFTLIDSIVPNVP